MPTLTDQLKKTARSHDLASWQRLLPSLDNTKDIAMAVKSARRAGWVEGLQMLWDLGVLAPLPFLKTIWMDERNPFWSIVTDRGVATYDWMVARTWPDGTTANAEAAWWALIAVAKYHHNPKIWQRLIAQPLAWDHPQASRVVDALGSLDHWRAWTHPDRHPSDPKIWHAAALDTMLDRGVSGSFDTLVRAFQLSTDARLEALIRTMTRWTALQRSLALIKIGLLDRLPQRSTQAAPADDLQRFPRSMMESLGIDSAARREHVLNRMLSQGVLDVLRVPTDQRRLCPPWSETFSGLVTAPFSVGLFTSPQGIPSERDITTFCLPRLDSYDGVYVADYWWASQWMAGPADLPLRNRHRAILRTMVETLDLQDFRDRTLAPSSMDAPIRNRL